MSNEFKPVGHIKKPYGVNGELKIFIEAQYLEDTLQAEVLFVSIKAKPVPYFVEAFRESGNLLVKFEDINTPEEAIKLSSKSVSLRSTDILPDDEREYFVEDGLQYSPYVGFLLEDEMAGPIGKIEAIEEYPQQEMALVNYKEKQLLIPMHKDLILEIDDQKRKILIQLPGGLLEL